MEQQKVDQAALLQIFMENGGKLILPDENTLDGATAKETYEFDMLDFRLNEIALSDAPKVEKPNVINKTLKKIFTNFDEKLDGV